MTDNSQQTASAPVPNANTGENSIMPQKSSKTARRKSISYYDIMAHRKWLRAKLKKVEKAGVKKASLYNNKRLSQLYQSSPCELETYTKHKNRSFTDSLESYQNGANKKRQILQWNMQKYGREPKKEIVIHLLKEFSAEAIKKLRKWIFDFLKQAGIRAITNIELTRTRPRTGKPNNRVHFHILTDDPRSKKELRAIFKMACEWSVLTKKDFRINYNEINNGYWYFEYFTKYDRFARAEIKALKESKIKAPITKNAKDWDYWDPNKDWDWDGNKDVDTKEVIGKAWRWKSVVLFGPYIPLILPKFKTIGNWFEKGKGQGVIWKEIRAYMAEKDKNEQK